MFRRTLVWLLPFTLLFTGSQNVALAAPSPTEHAKETIDAVIEILKDDSLDREAKNTKILAIIDHSFNFRWMSRRTLARNWKKADKAQQARFVELYREHLTQTYLKSLEDYTDEQVRFVKETFPKKSYAQVNTIIVRKGIETPVNYRMKLAKNGQWYVYDVVIEGVSLVKNFRTSYNDIIRRDGMDGLLGQMEKKLQAVQTVTN
jgi:phospholipid transport system substrate-binding protein